MAQAVSFPAPQQPASEPRPAPGENAQLDRISAWRPVWVCLFLLLLTGTLFALAIYLFSPAWTQTSQELDVDIRSPLRANYGADPVRHAIPPVHERALYDALNDQAGQKEAGINPVATLISHLRTPVPTVTPLFPVLALPTHTPQAATATFEHTATSLPTRVTPTDALTATETHVPTATRTAFPTRTAAAPTDPPFQPEPTSDTIEPTAPPAPPEPTSPPAPDPGSEPEDPPYPPPSYP